MTKFAYNNAKNINIGHIFFEFNCKYYLYIFYKENLNSYLKSKLQKNYLLSFKI